MDVKTLLFNFFSLILLFAALRVITSKNPVHAALYLVLAFFQASAIWLLLDAEFLAMVLVLVYVGAVMVLFLFVVMMLDINTENTRVDFWRYFPWVAGVGSLVALEMSAVLHMGFDKTDVVVTSVQAINSTIQTPIASVFVVPNTKNLGILLYTQYLYPLQIAAVILFVAMVSAIALTLRRRKDSKYTDPAHQVRVKAIDRLKVIKMAPTQHAVIQSEVTSVVLVAETESIKGKS